VIAQFGRFTIVGIVGTAIDFALFWLLLRAGLWEPAAVTIAYCLATATQFVLNRQYSFRSFDRAALDQARTYAVVSLANLGVALAFVQIGTQVAHLQPMIAKAISIPPSVAVSFFGNRYLAFGPGIRARLRSIFKS
jgi:putative flippase GtrA